MNGEGTNWAHLNTGESYSTYIYIYNSCFLEVLQFMAVLMLNIILGTSGASFRDVFKHV